MLSDEHYTCKSCCIVCCCQFVSDKRVKLELVERRATFMNGDGMLEKLTLEAFLIGRPLLTMYY